MNAHPGNFTAVLLVGGKSSRMGRDKASLVIDGIPLWQRQLATLRSLEPQELLISGPPDGPYRDAGFKIVPDVQDGAGPLGGLQAVLRRAANEWLLVLAVDLPDVPASLLAELLRTAHRDEIGQVPTSADWFQPLAAVYPRTCLPLVEECLATGRRSLRQFISRARECRLVAARPIPPAELELFRNLNTPADLLEHDLNPPRGC